MAGANLLKIRKLEDKECPPTFPRNPKAFHQSQGMMFEPLRRLRTFIYQPEVLTSVVGEQRSRKNPPSYFEPICYYRIYSRTYAPLPRGFTPRVPSRQKIRIKITGTRNRKIYSRLNNSKWRPRPHRWRCTRPESAQRP